MLSCQGGKAPGLAQTSGPHKIRLFLLAFTSFRGQYFEQPERENKGSSTGQKYASSSSIYLRREGIGPYPQRRFSACRIRGYTSIFS